MELPDYSAFAASAPDTNQLSQLSDLARRLQAAEAKIAQREAELKAAEEEARVLSEVDIPDLMKALRLKELTLDDGAKLKVGTALRASISAENKDEAHAWLKANGQEAIIKRTVVAAFNRGEEQKASALVTELLKKGVSAKSEEKVESSTLKKVLGDMIKGGAAVPMETFGAYLQTFTEIKQPKAK